MNSSLKNILAVAAGIAVGALINMGLIILGGSLIPPPEGVGAANTESLAQNMDLLESRHFLVPLIAHALGTLVGAFVTTKVASVPALRLALIIGFFFLFGGMANIMMLAGTPTWFIVLDLLLAYLPMAWLGYYLGEANFKIIAKK